MVNILTRLPHIVSLQSETRTAFEGGAYTTSWSTLSIHWANVSVDVSNQDYSHDKNQQMTKYEVVMRANSAIKNTKRLLYSGKILVIESVHDGTNRGRMMTLKCREEVV